VNTKFLGLQIENHVNLKKYFEQIIPQFGRVCYAMRSVVHISNINTLKSIYHAYFHCYKISNNFWGVTLPTVGRFSLYKIKSPELWLVHSCRSLFKQLEILPAPCPYILSLMYFIIANQEIFHTNSSIHDIKTGTHHVRPNANLACL
jgi:hypothetical protein